MRRDQFTAVLRDTQWRSVQNAVQTGGHLRGSQVDLIEERQSAIAHGKGQRTILKGHVAVLDGQMAHQVSEFQPAVACHLENRAASCLMQEVLPQPVGPKT